MTLMWGKDLCHTQMDYTEKNISSVEIALVVLNALI